MTRALTDPWAQALAFAAAMAGALSAYARVAPSPAAGARPAARLIVDGLRATDSDTADLAAALAGAPAGAVVYVRAGTYRGPLLLSQPVRLVGLAARPGDVIVEGPAGVPLVDVAGAAVSISSLTLRGGAPAVLVRDGGTARLKAVAISGGEGGVLARGRGASAELERVQILRSGTDGAAARDGARLTLARAEIIGQKGCGVLAAAGTSVSMRASTVTLSGYGVCAEGGALVDDGDSDLSGNLNGPSVRRP